MYREKNHFSFRYPTTGLHRGLILIIAFIVIYPFQASSQIPTIQDCLGARIICQATYVEDIVLNGSGNYPNELWLDNTANCGMEDNRGIYYIFTVDETGDFGFLVTPMAINDDFDWMLFDITGKTCDDLAVPNDLVVSCNESGCTGETGANGGSNSNSEPGGCNNGTTPFNALVPVVEGNTYLLFMQNWSGSQMGYTIDFNLSTAGVIGSAGAHFLVAEIPCSSTNIVIQSDQNLLCSSLVDGEFYITDSNGTIIPVTFAPGFCDVAVFTNTIELVPTVALIEGESYTVHLGQGVTDICQFEIGITEIPFVFNFVDCPEDCFNGIDDDNDGLVDVFDPDCECVTSAENIIPNGDFESTDGCCTDLLFDQCVNDWDIIGGGSADYYHPNCDNFYNSDIPITSGCIAGGILFASNAGQPIQGSGEVMYVCLTSPLEGNQSYQFNIDVAANLILGEMESNHAFVFYGIPNCADAPNYGNGDSCWNPLPQEELFRVNYNDLEIGWNSFSFDIQTNMSHEAIYFFADCLPVDGQADMYYTLFDNLSIIPSSENDIIIEGAICSNDLLLTVDWMSGANYTWYQDSVEIANTFFLNLFDQSINEDNEFHVYIELPNGECQLVGPVTLTEEPDISITTDDENFNCTNTNLTICLDDISTNISLISLDVYDADFSSGYVDFLFSDDIENIDYSEPCFDIELIMPVLDYSDVSEIIVVINHETVLLNVFDLDNFDNEIGECDLSNNYFVLDLEPISTFTLGPDINDCNDSYLILGPPDYNTYLWSDQSTNQNLEVSESGEYILTAFDNCNREIKDTILVVLGDIGTFTQTVSNTCQGNAEGAITIEFDDIPADELTFQWENNIGMGNEATNVESGTYMITVTFEQCEQVIEIEVEEFEPLVATVLSTDTLCYGATNGFVEIESNNNNIESVVLNNVEYDFPIMFENLGPGIYNLMVIDEYGCSEDFQFNIEEYTELDVTLPDTIFTSISELLEISLLGSIPGNAVISWSPASIVNCSPCNLPLFIGDQSTTLTATITLDDCEQQVATYIVYDDQLNIYVPNIFNPDSQSGNDTFGPLGLNGFANFTMHIFDRWGNLIFDRTKIDELEYWDGSFKEKDVSEGVYMYYIEFEFFNGKTVNRKGTITLVR